MITADLRRRCEAIARLEQQRKEIADEIKELKATAKSDGYDVPLITKTVSLMLKDTAKQKKAIEQHSLFDSYLSAVGLLPDDEQEAGQVEPAPTKVENSNSAGVLSSYPAERGRGLAAATSAPAAPIPPPPVPQTTAAEQAAGFDPPEPAADLSIPDFLRRNKIREVA